MSKVIYVVGLDEDKELVDKAIKEGKSVAVQVLYESEDGTIIGGWDCHNFSHEQFVQFKKMAKEAHEAVKEIQRCLND